MSKNPSNYYELMTATMIKFFLFISRLKYILPEATRGKVLFEDRKND